MINCDIRNGKGLIIQGDIKDVSAECILVMREIYKKNKEYYNDVISYGFLLRMVKAAIDNNGGQSQWKPSQEEIMGYTE